MRQPARNDATEVDEEDRTGVYFAPPKPHPHVMRRERVPRQAQPTDKVRPIHRRPSSVPDQIVTPSPWCGPEIQIWTTDPEPTTDREPPTNPDPIAPLTLDLPELAPLTLDDVPLGARFENKTRPRPSSSAEARQLPVFDLAARPRRATPPPIPPRARAPIVPVVRASGSVSGSVSTERRAVPPPFPDRPMELARGTRPNVRTPDPETLRAQIWTERDHRG